MADWAQNFFKATHMAGINWTFLRGNMLKFIIFEKNNVLNKDTIVNCALQVTVGLTIQGYPQKVKLF